MDDLAIFAAKWLIWLLAGGFALAWWLAENRDGKLRLALSAVAGPGTALVLIKLCSALYFDPRPFVADPSIVPLIPHAPDNGFPSNHASAAGLLAVLIALRHRVLGVLFIAAAVAVAWGRVAVQVHHVLDVATGLALGAAAAVVGSLVAVAWFRQCEAWRSRTRD